MLTNISEKMEKFLQDDGTLPKWAWPGGYPLFYFDKEGNTLCPTCANKNDEYSPPITNFAVNWEEPDLYCDHCSQRIESAYAEDEARNEDEHFMPAVL